MSLSEMEIIEAEVCTPVNESIVKHDSEILDSEDRNEMARMFKILLDHYEKTSGKVIYRFELNCRLLLSFCFSRIIQLLEAWIFLRYHATGELKR